MTQWHNIRPLLTLLAFLALWWLAPAVLKRFSGNAFYEFQAPVLLLQSHTQDLQSYWALRGQSKNGLIEAGRDLARDNAQLQTRLQETNELSAEVKRLERLLNLPASQQYHYEVARVAERSMSAWWQQIIIAKGSNHGIPVGAAVVYSGGVVGRVKAVYATTSVVELVSSPGFRMASNIEGGTEPITYTGLVTPPFEPPLGLAINVPPGLRASNSQPLRLVSSALGGIFPAGLTIGEIYRLEPGHDGYFQQGSVRLSPELNRLREVAVIIPAAGRARAPGIAAPTPTLASQSAAARPPVAQPAATQLSVAQSAAAQHATTATAVRTAATVAGATRSADASRAGARRPAL